MDFETVAEYLVNGVIRGFREHVTLALISSIGVILVYLISLSLPDGMLLSVAEKWVIGLLFCCFYMLNRILIHKERF